LAFNRRNADEFQGMGAEYDRLRPEFPERLYSDVLHEAGLKKGARVLDVGCGTGKATAHIAGKGFRILGVDPSPTMLAVARARHFPDTKFKACRFEDFPETKKFDLIIAAQAFHWVDPRVGYPKIHRLLNDNGLFALFTYSPRFGDSTPRLHALLMRNCPDYPFDNFAAKMDETAIARSGLFEFSVKHYQRVMRYRKKEFLDLLSTFSWIHSLPKEKKELLLSRIERKIRKPKVTLPRAVILILARKRGCPRKAH
jgi:SAM-dependent methyltransferase